MVVLNICKIGNFQDYNGLAVAIPQMVRHFKEINEDTGLFNLSNDSIGENYFIGSGSFELEVLPSPFNNPDIVIFHGIWIKEYVTIAKELRNCHIPYIIVPHGSLTRIALQIKRMKKIMARMLFFNSYIKGAQEIQFLSKEEQSNSKISNSSFVCGLGVPYQSLKKEYTNQYVKKLIYIGRIDYYIKGLDLLLDAIGDIKEEMLEAGCKLNIYGPYRSNSEATIKALIDKNGLGEIVFINKPIVGQEKIDRLLESDVFIQTSRSEGLPQGILEALSLGIPCAITEGTRLGDDVREYQCGLVCNTSKDAICLMLKDLLNCNIDLSIAGNNAVRLIDEKYRWKTISLELKERLYAIIQRSRI